jgi:glycerol-3-phosphate cytidylyltransferase-like family protein
VREAVLISGHFNNLDENDIAYIKKAKEIGKVVCVALYSDEWILRNLEQTGHDEKTRSKKLREISLIDYILDFNDSDDSINDALVQMRHIFPSAKIVVLYRENEKEFVINNSKANIRGVKYLQLN